MTRAEYIKKYSMMTVIASLGSGIFPETILIQGAIESANGTSLLSSKYNNFFGIKTGSDWKGPTVNLKTGEVFSGKKVTITSAFRVYSSYYASVRGLIKFLKRYDRYNNVFKAQDPEQQFRYLQLAGYATAPDYANVLISQYRAYKDVLNKSVGLDKAVIYSGLIGGAFAAFRFRQDLQKAASDFQKKYL
jgi:flagellum-specific peptidoglycan hydrolase FlgJ